MSEVSDQKATHENQNEDANNKIVFAERVSDHNNLETKDNYQKEQTNDSAIQMEIAEKEKLNNQNEEKNSVREEQSSKINSKQVSKSFDQNQKDIEIQEQQELKQKQQSSHEDQKSEEGHSKQQLKKSYSMKSNKSKQISEKEVQRQQQLEQIYGTTGVGNTSQSRLRNSRSQIFLRTPSQIDKRIVHDQINSSHSKQMYSFSKAKRFPKQSRPYCSTQFYENQIQSQLGSRSTALGYGIKFDFTKTDKYRPGPTSYDINTLFEQNIKHYKGVKFGYGREEAYKMGMLGNLNTAPGPGTYDQNDQKSPLKFSLGTRTKARHIYLVSTTPAPGTYDIGGLDSKGIYYIGKYKSSGAAMFSPTSSHMFESKRSKRLPGPGTYDPPGGIKDPRNYLPSNYMTSSQWKFGHGVRVTQEVPLLKTPGPGSYCIPSQFGDVDFPETVEPKSFVKK